MTIETQLLVALLLHMTVCVNSLYMDESNSVALLRSLLYLCFCRDVRQMLLKLVELQSSNWGRVHTAAVSSDATPDNDPNYFMVCIYA